MARAHALSDRAGTVIRGLAAERVDSPLLLALRRTLRLWAWLQEEQPGDDCPPVSDRLPDALTHAEALLLTLVEAGEIRLSEVDREARALAELTGFQLRYPSSPDELSGDVATTEAARRNGCGR